MLKFNGNVIAVYSLKTSSGIVTHYPNPLAVRNNLANWNLGRLAIKGKLDMVEAYRKDEDCKFVQIDKGVIHSSWSSEEIAVHMAEILATEGYDVRQVKNCIKFC